MEMEGMSTETYDHHMLTGVVNRNHPIELLHGGELTPCLMDAGEWLRSLQEELGSFIKAHEQEKSSCVRLMIGDATDAMEKLTTLMSASGFSTNADAILRGVFLGMALERCGIRKVEAESGRANKQNYALKKVNNRKSQMKSDKEFELRQRFALQRQKNPTGTKEGILEQVRNEMSPAVSLSTARRYAAGLQ